jgi:tetratricopeptide (TPR) repeat protein
MGDPPERLAQKKEAVAAAEYTAGPDLLTSIVDRFRKWFGSRANSRTFCAKTYGTSIAPTQPMTAPNTLHVRKANGYSELVHIMIGRFTALAVLMAVVSASPVLADARSDAKAQVAFGISVAQRGLWREAIYRWEKAVEIDPTYAAAFNDLAIAYEHEGQLEKARKAYEKALELDPNNPEIRQNFELFKEINDRTSSAKETP